MVGCVATLGNIKGENAATDAIDCKTFQKSKCENLCTLELMKH